MLRPKAVLLIGAGFLQCPFIEIARDLGLYVIATDGSPQAPGLALAHESYVHDCYDAEGTALLAQQLAERVPLRGVTCAGIDVSPTVSLCAERLGLPGLLYETACKTHNKALVREALEDAGLQHYQPRWMAVAGDWSTTLRATAITQGILGGWPVVVKPLEQRASRGVTIVRRAADLPTAVAAAMAYGEEYLIEQCLIGTEHSAEMVLRDAEVLWWNVVDRFFDYSSGTGIETGHVNPTCLDDRAQQAIQFMLLACARALGVTWGAFKIDVMLTASGPKVLEVTARLSGGFDSQWTSPATGRHPMRQLLQLACGLPVEAQGMPQCAAACAAILPQKTGVVTALPRNSTGIEAVWAVQPGDKIAPATHNGMRAGYALATGADQAEAWTVARLAADELADLVEAETEGEADGCSA